MATCTSVCAVCDLQNQISTSTHWCIECEEPLCFGCKEYHNVLKATRNHKTIPFSDYKLLPTVVTESTQNCVYHKKIYQLYCVKHESPICNNCIKDHVKCGEIRSLEEVVRDVKNSEFFIDLEQTLEDLLGNIIQMRKYRESNKKRITDQIEKITAQVCHLKKQVIMHVNKLEEEFIKEIDKIKSNYCDPIRSTLSSLQDKEREISQMKSEIQNTKKYASDLQTFLSMREIQPKTTEYEKYLKLSNENNDHEKISIDSSIDTRIQAISTVQRFGSIIVKKCQSPNIKLISRKDKQAQIIVLKTNKLSHDVKLELERKLDTTCKYPPGCCVTKRGEFLVTSYEKFNENIIAINAKGEIQNTISLKESHSAFDVACLDDNTVAVSSGCSSLKPGISFIDLTKRIVIKFIDLPNNPYGVTYDGKSLICCVEDEDLHVISCTDYSITTISNTVLPKYSYVTVHGDKIYFTNPEKSKVKCCLYSGALVWEFKDESVLKCSWGITIDNKGNVFVAGKDSFNVVVISPDGKQCKQILTEKDGLERPTGILFDKVRKQMFVTNHKQFAYIYNISYI